MRHSKFVQVITICSFVLLIGVFLFYRTGAFNKKHTKNQSITKQIKDSIVINKKNSNEKINTDSQPLRLYSSKSMPVLDPSSVAEYNNEDLRLSSSKSVVIGEPTILKLDTNTFPLRLYSSKSLILTIQDQFKLDSAFMKLISPEQTSKSDSTKIQKKGITTLKNIVFIDSLITDTTKKRK
jgi:hypothetical protein